MVLLLINEDSSLSATYLWWNFKISLPFLQVYQLTLPNDWPHIPKRHLRLQYDSIIQSYSKRLKQDGSIIFRPFLWFKNRCSLCVRNKSKIRVCIVLQIHQFSKLTRSKINLTLNIKLWPKFDHHLYWIIKNKIRMVYSKYLECLFVVDNFSSFASFFLLAFLILARVQPLSVDLYKHKNFSSLNDQSSKYHESKRLNCTCRLYLNFISFFRLIIPMKEYLNMMNHLICQKIKLMQQLMCMIFALVIYLAVVSSLD